MRSNGLSMPPQKRAKTLVRLIRVDWAVMFKRKGPVKPSFITYFDSIDKNRLAAVQVSSGVFRCI